MREETSSSKSGIHFGHYKARCADVQLAAIDAAMARIPFVTSYSPTRWQEGLNVMIEKKAGNYRVDKLRTILLYEADFNQNNKLMAKTMMRQAETHQLLAPEQYGSRKFHNAQDQSLNKCLTFDILRQTRTRAGMAGVDLKSCYDRIVHSAAGLAMQRVGCPHPAIESSFQTIQQLRHFIRTIYGDSTRSFSANQGHCPVLKSQGGPTKAELLTHREIWANVVIAFTFC